jgi:L-ascorbate metabolism protein UlaG (beta-lactamase superfamily)
MAAMDARDPVMIHYVGGPTAILDIGGIQLVTDPTFDPPGEYRSGSGSLLTKTEYPALTGSQLGTPDAVLLSHDQHVDNLDASGREFLGSAPLVLTTPAAAGRLGGRSQGLAPFEQAELGRPGRPPVRITAVPAQHGPDGSEHLTGPVTGFVLDGDQVPVTYISGDNASLDTVAAIAGRFGPVEIALLFAGAAVTPTVPGAFLTLTSAQAAEAARILGAAQVVPLHLNSWKHLTEGAAELEKAFAQAGLADRLTLLEPGQAVIW